MNYDVPVHTVDELLNRALQRLKQCPGFFHVKFIFLYGSVAHGRATRESDIDLCIYYEGSKNEAGEFRFTLLKALFDDRFDIQIFLDLPLYVRMEVIHGRLIYAPDERFVYDVAYDTIREFEAFKHRLYDYIGKKAIT